MTLELDNDETDVLAFILDTVLEGWADQKDAQQKHIASDPTLKSWEDLLGVALAMDDAARTAERIRAKLEPA